MCKERMRKLDAAKGLIDELKEMKRLSVCMQSSEHKQWSINLNVYHLAKINTPHKIPLTLNKKIRELVEEAIGVYEKEVENMEI